MRNIWKHLLAALLIVCLLCSAIACTPPDPDKDPTDSSSQEETTNGDPTETTAGDATSGEDVTTGGEDVTTGGEDVTTGGEDVTTGIVDGPGLELYPDETGTDFGGVTPR